MTTLGPVCPYSRVGTLSLYPVTHHTHSQSPCALALLSELASSLFWESEEGWTPAQTQDFPTRQYKLIRVGSWAEASSEAWLGRREVKYSLTIPFATWTQITKGRIRESACDLFRSVYTQKRPDGWIMILSICKQSALNFILAITLLLDRIKELLHVDRDLLFEPLDSAWIRLWTSSDKHPAAILVYFCSPKYFIFKNYFSRWIYFTHHVNYSFLFKNEEYAWSSSLCRELQREGLELSSAPHNVRPAWWIFDLLREKEVLL